MSFTRDEIVSKVKKLLKLAESSNVNEAAQAAAKAQELMDRFEIEAAAISAESPAEGATEPVETFGDFESSGRLENWKGMVLSTLCKTNSCMAYKERSRLNRETVLRVIGRRTDSQTVRYMYQSLSQLVEGLAVTQRGNGRAFIASFKLGAANAICQRIVESKEKTKQAVYQEAAQAGTQALMRVDNAVAVLTAREGAMRLYMAEKNLRLKSGGKTRARSADGYHQGYAAGQRADMGGGSARPLTAGRSALNA